MGSKQETDSLHFLNDGLDSKTEYTFYWKRDWLYIWFYVAASRKQRACKVDRPEVVDTAYRAEARRIALDIVSEEREGRVVDAGEVDRVRTAARLDELSEAWKRDQVEKYPSSYETRWIQISNAVRVLSAIAPPLALTALQCAADDRGPQLFLDARMRQVSKETVKKEVGILFHFLDWLKFHGYIQSVPPRPKYRKKDRGTRIGPQRAAPVHLSDEAALRIIMRLPEYAHRGGRTDPSAKRPDSAFVCRDWMRFAYETSLRPSTVAKLKAGVHWIRGNRFVRVTADIDKGGNVALEGKPRNVPLTQVAYDILTKHAPTSGVIFGDHDIRVQWKRAAVAVLGEEEGRLCAPYDLRHGANFRMRSTVGGTLAGAMHMTGHARGTTNDLYMVGSEEEARELVGRLDKRNAELEKKLRRRR